MGTATMPAKNKVRRCVLVRLFFFCLCFSTRTSVSSIDPLFRSETMFEFLFFLLFTIRLTPLSEQRYVPYYLREIYCRAARRHTAKNPRRTPRLNFYDPSVYLVVFAADCTASPIKRTPSGLGNGLLFERVHNAGILSCILGTGFVVT